jgi:hypothetical protein
VFHSNDLSVLSRFLFEWRFLVSSLASLAARVGRVTLRFRGIISARRTRSARRSSARPRLRLWLRMSLATTRTLPSVVSLAESLSSSRARCSSLSARDVEMFQKISTREEVLLTCCPPAPDALDTLTSSSLRGIEREPLMGRSFSDAGAGTSLKSSPPAEQLESRKERHEAPDDDDQNLRRHRCQRCALEHVGAQRIIDRRQWERLDQRLHYLWKVRR